MSLNNLFGSVSTTQTASLPLLDVTYDLSHSHGSSRDKSSYVRPKQIPDVTDRRDKFKEKLQ